jgi:hypothetical protein
MAESVNEQLHIDRCSDPLVASAIPDQSYSLFLIGGFEQTFSPSPGCRHGLLLKQCAVKGAGLRRVKTPDRELVRSTAGSDCHRVRRFCCQRWFKRGVNCWAKVVNPNNIMKRVPTCALIADVVGECAGRCFRERPGENTCAETDVGSGWSVAFSL